MVPTSLLNPEIALPPKTFWERWGLLEVPPGPMPQPRDFVFYSTHRLVDLSWERWVPLIQPDDINKIPLYGQYLYQEADDYDDEEEEMEIDDRILGNARDTCVATLTGT